MGEGSYGVIQEQGDLGLGFNPLNEEENRIVNESTKEQKETEE